MQLAHRIALQQYSSLAKVAVSDSYIQRIGRFPDAWKANLTNVASLAELFTGCTLIHHESRPQPR